jgi:hypothetical protein
MSPEEVQYEVDTIMGLTEDESMVWINIKCKKLARENVIKPAFEKAKKHLGTTPSPEEEGQNVDATDGRVLEMICANFLTDPNFDTPEAPPVPEPELVIEADSDTSEPLPTVEENFNDQ